MKKLFVLLFVFTVGVLFADYIIYEKATGKILSIEPNETVIKKNKIEGRRVYLNFDWNTLGVLFIETSNIPFTYTTNWYYDEQSNYVYDVVVTPPVTTNGLKNYTIVSLDTLKKNETNMLVELGVSSFSTQDLKNRAKILRQEFFNATDDKERDEILKKYLIFLLMGEK